MLKKSRSLKLLISQLLFTIFVACFTAPSLLHAAKTASNSKHPEMSAMQDYLDIEALNQKGELTPKICIGTTSMLRIIEEMINNYGNNKKEMLLGALLCANLVALGQDWPEYEKVLKEKREEKEIES